MKKLYILSLGIAAFFAGSAAIAQGTIYDNGADVSGTTINVTTSDLDELLYPHDLIYRNESGADQDVLVRRVLICKNGDFGVEQLCFNKSGEIGLCFSPGGNDVDYTIPSGASSLLGHMDSLILEPKHDGNGTDAIVKTRFYIVNKADGTMLDSVDINYTFGTATCTADIESEALASDVSVYPNPANDIVNFNVRLEGAQNASLIIVDMLGKQVYTNAVAANQTHKVNTSNFKQGIYFYSLKVGNKVLETKKLVVKH